MNKKFTKKKEDEKNTYKKLEQQQNRERKILHQILKLSQTSIKMMRKLEKWGGEKKIYI